VHRRNTSLAAELKACGAVLIRASNHQVWKLPNGAQFVCGRTPSDHRAEQNAIKVLRKLLERGTIRGE
jgi:hypothetical protein